MTTKQSKRFSTVPQKMRSARNELGRDYILMINPKSGLIWLIRVEGL